MEEQASEKENYTPNIVPRRFYEIFDAQEKKYWFEDSPFLTRMLDSYTLLVPDNEQYYIRNIQKCYSRIKNPKLKRQIKNFFRQESQHGIAHKRYWENLKLQRVPIEKYIKFINLFLYKFLEPITPLKLRISVISFIEYINAYMGNIFLRKNLLRTATPPMRRLFEWHFAEEIEHKAVAFEVYQTLSGNYLLRALTAFLVFPIFYLLLSFGAFYMLYWDGKLFRRKTWNDLFQHLFWRDKVFFENLGFLWKYLKPGFHPWDIEDYGLAAGFFNQDSLPILEMD